MKQQTQFFTEYIQLYRPLLNRLNMLLAPYSLYNSQWAILKLLKQEGEMTSADIAARRQVEKPSVTKMVHRLLEMGLVEVRTGTDRREKWIGLSDQGHQTVDRIKLELDALYDGLLDGAAQEDIDTAVRMMELAKKNLDN